MIPHPRRGDDPSAGGIDVREALAIQIQHREAAGARRDRTRAVVKRDRRVKTAQLRTWLDTSLPHPHAAGVAIGLERVGLASGPVQASIRWAWIPSRNGCAATSSSSSLKTLR